MSEPATPRELIPAECLAEAGVWITRLHSGERDETAIAGVKKWLESDPMNAKALELCTEVWEESAGLKRVTTFLSPAPARRRLVRFTVVATAVVLGVAVLGSAFLLRHPEVSTGVGEQRLLNLSDGSRVYLNTATRIRVDYDSRTRLVELESGEALFDVANRSNWPFVVRAGDRRIKALGTSFVVRRDAKLTTVTLVEGKVAVTGDVRPEAPGTEAAEARNGSGSGTDFTLTPGQRLTLSAGRAQLDVAPLDKAIAWRKGQVVLDDTPLTSAVAEMNRYSQVKLVIERAEAGTLTVNGLFQAGDSASFARAVAQTYGLVVVERNDRIILAGAPTRATQQGSSP
jgi:transmembrane sensor